MIISIIIIIIIITKHTKFEKNKIFLYILSYHGWETNRFDLIYDILSYIGKEENYDCF